MTIASELVETLAVLEAMPVVALPADPTAAARATHERDAAFFAPAYLRPAVAEIEEAEVPGEAGPIPIRIYRPSQAQDGRVPTVLWIHGGGWVTGSLHTADNLARSVASGCGAVVVSVDYRLAPEHRWPAGLHDVLAAFAWVQDNIGILGGDLGRLGVGGDSSGGNLAAIVAQVARERQWPLQAQLLVYPVVDSDAAAPYESRRTFATGYYVTWEAIESCIDDYLPADADPKNPLISPIHQPELAGLAAAVVATVELDTLRDEGDRYAELLASSGVRVVQLRSAGLPHGAFDMVGASPTAQRAVDEAVAAFGELLNQGAGDDGRAQVEPDGEGTIPFRFLHVNKAVMLQRAPLAAPAQQQLTAAVVGCDLGSFRRTERELSGSVHRAAQALLDDPRFRDALESIEVRPGERIVALGDSITDDSCSWAEQLKVVLAAVRPDVSVINQGVTGATTQDQLARIDLLCAARPTWVIQMLGTNDARRQGRNTQARMLRIGETERNLRKLTDLLTADAGAELTRMTPTPVIGEWAERWQPFLDEQIAWRSDEVAEVAQAVLDLDPAAVDLHAAMLGSAEDLLLPDGVHPRLAGQTEILRTLVFHLAGNPGARHGW